MNAARGLSLRWKLSATYAGIALLTVAALGVILVVVLGSHFARAEDAYLRAAAIRAGRTLLRTGDLPTDLERQVRIVALNTQTRVQVYDSDGTLAADSGTPNDIDPGALIRPEEGAPGLPGRGRLPAPLGGGIFGAARDAGPRSERSLRLVLEADDGRVVGDVVLSEGPASGQDVLAGVVQALALSAIVAVLLAAVVGYVISGRISRPIVALTATTDRMAAGDLRARAEVLGDDEVGRLGTSFNEMAERIETTFTTLRRFVADAAHEIGTPLTALQADLELAGSASASEDETRFVSRALEQARRLEHLSSNLLRLSRLEAGEAIVELAPVDVVALVRAAADGAASRTEQAGLSIRLELPSRPVDALADAGRLAAVLENLLDNAIKFTPNGGVVQVGVERGDRASLWVSDTGIGIPADQQDAVFERFFRGRNVPAYPGSGLGLAIARATLEQMGASISFSSSESGTRFDVSLPLASRPDEGPPPVEPIAGS